MNRPDILLVNPWIHDFAAYDLWARPMGLLVLGTWLRRAGWEPRLLDCLDQDHSSVAAPKLRAHGQGRFPRTAVARPPALQQVPRKYSRYGVEPEQIRNDLAAMPVPRVILITGLMTYWYPGVQETIRVLRECFPEVPVLLGGVYATLLPEHAREHSNADYVVAGPGEVALPGILATFARLRFSGDRPTEHLEFEPALDLMRRVRFLPLLTSRGCPLKCSYCASGRLVRHFVRRKADDVVSEIERARLQHGISDVALYDDAFLIDARVHALPILEAVYERVPGLRWHTPNGLHASEIDARVAHAMKRAGFETIRIGLESSSDAFHAITGKKTDMQGFLAAIRHLKEAGFSRDQIGVYLLVGLPGQSRDRIEDDVDRVLAAGAMPKLAEYSPIPGTAMWTEALGSSRYPIDREPLFQNCTLLAAAEPEVNWAFLRETRERVRAYLDSSA